LDDVRYQRLETIFSPNVKERVKLKASGAKINLPTVFKWEASREAGGKSIESRIFESVEIPEKKDYVITTAVDLSGSMRGEKIQETFKGVVLLSEVLNRLGIKNEVLGFSNDVRKFKDLNEDLNDVIRYRMGGMLRPNGDTYTDRALALASKELDQVSAKEKFILVMTDGNPSTPEKTYQEIQRILKRTDQKLVGIGLGPNTDLVKEFFPAAIPNINVRDLPEMLGGLLEDLIMNPDKYSYRAENQ
jgi:nitric oxide reductase activation protein